jgi:hypothetical protein
VGVVERTLKVMALDEEYWGELLGEAGLGAGAQEPEQAEQPIDLPEEAGAKTRQKPSGFTLFGQFYPAGSWRGVLLGVCATLAQRHGTAFAPAVFEVKGKKRQYIAPSPEGMIGPAQIPGTDLWVEANQSAVSVQRLVERLLVALGHEPGEFAVIVEE